jgi:hypothetical protein
MAETPLLSGPCQSAAIRFTTPFTINQIPHRGEKVIECRELRGTESNRRGIEFFLATKMYHFFDPLFSEKSSLALNARNSKSPGQNQKTPQPNLFMMLF